MRRCRPGPSRCCSPTSRARRGCFSASATRYGECSRARPDPARAASRRRRPRDRHPGRRFLRRVRAPGTRWRPPSTRSARWPPRTSATGTACACGWGCTAGEPRPAARATPASACTARRASAPRRPRRPGVALRRRPTSCSRTPADGVGCRDLGEHRLKDFDRPERLFQLSRDGLERLPAAQGPQRGAAAPVTRRRLVAGSPSRRRGRGDHGRRVARRRRGEGIACAPQGVA